MTPECVRRNYRNGEQNADKRGFVRKPTGAATPADALGEPKHVHHIIPIMSGGTNEAWNLMTLCASCHKKADAFVRAYAGFSPVLKE